MGAPFQPPDRILPSQGAPGPVTALIKAGAHPGETGTDVLDRVGKQLVPSRSKMRDRKLPRQLAAIIACRTEGMSDAAIAKALGLATGTVRGILMRARKELGLSDLVDRVEHRAVHTAVDNLIDGLDHKDKDYTLATLKGMGVFKHHSAVKQESSAQVSNELRVVFELPDGAAAGALPQVAIGAIMATPRRIAAPIAALDPVIDVEATHVAAPQPTPLNVGGSTENTLQLNRAGKGR